MDNGPRKATDVLLDLESKIDTLLEVVKSQDLNIRILSNKLNVLLESQRQQLARGIDKPTAEVISQANVPVEEQKIVISPEDTLPLEQSPKGFRRTSRPETYAGDDAYLGNTAPKMPMQIPKQAQRAEIVVPKAKAERVAEQVQHEQTVISQNAVPILQRVVDKNGKSIFLADVEISNTANNEKVVKTRTNGTGKWMASLIPGNYRVLIRKRDSMTKEKVEASQDLVIDGNTSPLNLPMLVFKQ